MQTGLGTSVARPAPGPGTRAPEADREVEPGVGPGRRVVFVAGSGRSGTSAFAGILQHFGVHVPQPEVPADASNPRGFAEPQWLVDFHDQLLLKAKVHVSDSRPQAWFEAGKRAVDDETRNAAAAWLEEQFRHADELVLKDPRLIWFLGLWQGVAIRLGAESSVITMLRPPTEVVGSKRTYYGPRGETDILAAWVNMMLHTERATRDANRQLIQYHDLLDDWTVPLFRVGEALDLASIRQASASKINSVHQFVDPALRRVNVSWDELEVPELLRDLAIETWELLAKLGDGEDPGIHDQLDEVRKRYADYYAEAESIAYSSQYTLMMRIQRLQRRRNDLKQRLADLNLTNAKLRKRNRTLAERLRDQEQRVADLEAQLGPTVYTRVKQRVPEPAKQSLKRILGRDANEASGD